MTDNQENKPKKLTLSGAKLHLSKPTGQTSITTHAHSYVSSKSKTIVEVKKSKISSSTLTFNKVSNITRDGEAASEEFNKRLAILKKAAEDAKIKEDDNTISTLSKLASINKYSSTDEGSVRAVASEEHDVTKETRGQAYIEPIQNGVPQIGRSATMGLPSHLTEDKEDLIEKDKYLDGKAVPPKAKVEVQKKLKKTDIFHMLDEDEDKLPGRTRSLASIKRAREKEKRKTTTQQLPEKVYREVIIPEVITVSDLANRMSERATDVIRELMQLGVIATANQIIDADTAELVVTTLGHTAKRVQESDVENILLSNEDKQEDLKPRAPVVTVMGHVDHGKTSLLDALKSTDIAGKEAGGITQHIGAYRVNLPDGRAITFIDTPGHEAFSAMRSRGAQATDIVVIVVAADDGIKAQTIEAINHAKAANVPILVAINKIDKPDINLDNVKNELLSHNLVSEEFGGDIMVIPVSALKHTNLDKLEDAILLIAEMQELKANPEALASGVVIEARVDKSKGVVATVLVQRGTLRNGDIVVAGATYGRVKRLNNDKGEDVHSAAPSVPVEIYGLNEAPSAGDKFNVVQTEKQARDITEYRNRIAKEKKISVLPRSSLEDLFLKASGVQKTKELPIILKGDVQGSIEAIISSLLKLPNDEVKLRILHQGVGAITESDVTLAYASSAILIGFNVRANANALIIAEQQKVDIRYFGIIYNLLDDVKAIMSGMLSPIFREQYIGSVEIRQVFVVTKVGKVAGSYVTKGIIKRGAGVRLLRDNIVIHEGKLKTLKRFKEDVKEVREGYECGIAFENYEDIKEGDIVEVFEVIEEQKHI